MYDCIIIGTGPAGISAALTLKIRGANLLLIGPKGLSDKAGKAETVRNYPGFCGESGRELMDVMAAQLAEAEIDICDCQVSGIYPMGENFSVMCGQKMYQSATVILACGVAAPAIRGELELVGRGVSYCATCDGFLYRGKTIGIVCTDKKFEDEAGFLVQLAGHAYLFPLYSGCGISGENTEVIAGMPSEISGTQRVERLTVGDRELAVDGVFFLRSSFSPSVLLSGLAMEDGHICVDRMGKTSYEGCFAAGDCTGRPYQYAKAVGEGNVCAHSVLAYLRDRTKN